jgi:hypothetical protein
MDITINEDIETIELLDKKKDLRLENLEASVRRAIQTPLGYLSIFTLEEQGLNYLDSTIGSSIYQSIAEPVTLDFISQIQSAIYESISSSDLLIEVSNISIQLIDLDSINIILEINDLLNNGESLTINVNL